MIMLRLVASSVNMQSNEENNEEGMRARADQESLVDALDGEGSYCLGGSAGP
jgi:hypothetical protein